MTLSLKPSHVRRYAEIGKLLWKYSRSDIFHASAFVDANGELPSTNGKGAQPEDLADDLEAMGPTFVKLGQILSSRPDLLPAPYIKALSRLQDNVKPFSFADVERIVQSELGVRISKGFSFFDSEPLAAASLGQVHRAVLRDGRKVVVKVQRPGIRERIAEDFEVVEEIVEFLKTHTKLTRRYQFDKILDEFQRTLLNELDYQREAGNLRLIAENLKEFPRIRIPLPVADFTTRSVLTMEYVSGQKITELSPLRRIDLDGAGLADELFRAYLKQVLADGLFHADPHPGNILLLTDGRLGLIDFGSVGRLDSELRAALQRLLLALDRRDPVGLTDALLEVTARPDALDEQALERAVGALLVRHLAAGQVPDATMFAALFRIVARHELAVPPEFAATFRALSTLEGSLTILAPGFDIVTEAERFGQAQLRQRLGPAELRAAATDELVALLPMLRRLPRRMDRITAAVEGGRLSVNVRLLADERDRRVIDGWIQLGVLTVLAAAAGLMAVALLALRGGPAMTAKVGFYQFLGYCLLVICSLLALRVLAAVFRRT